MNNAKTEKRDNIFIMLKKLFSITGVKPIYFAIPTFLAVGAAFFEGVSVTLLMPLVKGMIKVDFSFAGRLPVLGVIITKFPSIFKGSNLPVFVMLLGIVFSAIVLQNALKYIASLNISRLVRGFSNGMRKIIFKRYLSFGKMFFDRTNAGYLNNVLMNYTTSLANRIIGFNKVFLWIFMLIVYLGIMFFISWKLTIFTLLAFPALYYSLVWLVRKIERTSRACTDSRNTLSRKVFNVLMCIPLVKFYSAEEREGKEFTGVSDQVESLELSVDKKQMLIDPAQEIIAHIVILLLISVMTFLLIKGKSGNVPGFIVYFYLLKRTTSTLSLLNQLKGSITGASGPAAELLKVFDDEDKYFLSEGKKKFDGLSKSIDFRNLSFCYREGVKVLDNITLSIEKGKMIALVGPTGSGKTTLINLIARFYDSPSSSLLIDGTDIEEFSSKSLRRHMALVSQDIFLFNDTLRKNITYGLEREITDEELFEVLKKARLYDYVVRLPEGLGTYVGDRGVQLSGGEKQRVSIARALLKDVEILMMDEATSSLDTKTERMIQEAIDEIVEDKTVIVIAHRLTTVRHADKIVVIESGRLMEEGSLDELLEKKGKFYEYWEEQKFIGT